MNKLMQFFSAWRRPAVHPEPSFELLEAEAKTQQNEQRLRDLILKMEAEIITRTISRTSE